MHLSDYENIQVINMLHAGYIWPACMQILLGWTRKECTAILNFHLSKYTCTYACTVMCTFTFTDNFILNVKTHTYHQICSSSNITRSENHMSCLRSWHWALSLSVSPISWTLTLANFSFSLPRLREKAGEIPNLQLHMKEK